MKVVEIFHSIDGEGKRTGQSAAFIRLAGCNMRCSYCDTLYALFGEKEECVYTEMSVEEIVSRIKCKRVTITGGEPLIHKDIDELIKELCRFGCEINIETNGSVNTEKYNIIPNLFVTIDYKLPSSGMSDKMQIENFLNLRSTDVIKFVVGSEEDIKCMKRVVGRLKAHYAKDELPIMYTGAVFGEMEPKRLVDEILSCEELEDMVFQLQIHKFIWNPEDRGV